jgi:hypothetical protein
MVTRMEKIQWYSRGKTLVSRWDNSGSVITQPKTPGVRKRNHKAFERFPCHLWAIVSATLRLLQKLQIWWRERMKIQHEKVARKGNKGEVMEMIGVCWWRRFGGSEDNLCLHFRMESVFIRSYRVSRGTPFYLDKSKYRPASSVSGIFLATLDRKACLWCR